MIITIENLALLTVLIILVGSIALYLSVCAARVIYSITRPKYIYGFDVLKVDKTLRKNRRSGAVEFIILAKDKRGHPMWCKMDSSHWGRFRAYTDRSI
jgi:hypothetical protein